MSLEKINTATRPIPNKYVEAAASPTSRKVLVTMNRDLWTGCLSDGQKRNGISQKDREGTLSSAYTAMVLEVSH